MRAIKLMSAGQRGEGRLERMPAPRLNPRTRRLRRGASCSTHAFFGPGVGTAFPLTPLLTGNAVAELDMTHNYVAACGINVDRLREALEKNSALHTLSLRRCCIGGWRRARAIARGLALNRGLTSVDLSYNGLGAASQQAAPPQPAALSLAVEALCQALRSNRQLRALGLAHNCLGDGGGIAVLHAVLEGTPARRSNPARRRAGLGMSA